MTKQEVEQTETEFIFHHLHDVGGSPDARVRVAATPRTPQPNAPGELRDVSGYAAWELGAIAAAEDESLFRTGG